MTDTEAEVTLGMVDGRGLPAVAQSMGLAASTIRTHAHSVFGKTGTSRQAELVNLLAALTG